MWGSSSPSMVASVADWIVQGTKTMWQRSCLLLTVWQRERTNEKNNPQQLNLHDNKTPSSPNNDQWETRGKKNPKKKPGELLVSKCWWAVCSVPPDTRSFPVVEDPLTVAAGTRSAPGTGGLCDTGVPLFLVWLSWVAAAKKKSKDTVVPSPRDSAALSGCAQKKGVMKYLKGLLKNPSTPHLHKPRARKSASASLLCVFMWLCQSWTDWHRKNMEYDRHLLGYPGQVEKRI